MKFIQRIFVIMMVATSSLYGQVEPLNFEAFSYRNFSPHRVGSWISDIAVPETDDPAYAYTFYVSGRHSGVWKTINNGVTFFPVFENYGNLSIGAIDISKSDPEVVWVGTGEASNARSAYAGNGVYRSTDGGNSFQCMGLKDSHHISRIIVHPENADIVYVAAMGHLYSSNKQRGVFKTADGGESWEKILYIDDGVGVTDLVIHPFEPDILYAATYDKVRLPWHYEAGGEESGIYKTTNGGKKWVRLKGGLPDGNIGRIGIDIFRADPDILYAVVENLNVRPDYKEQQEEGEFYLRDSYFDRFIGGEVYRTADAGKRWKKMNPDSVDVSSKAAYSFNQIMVDPVDENNLFISSVYVQTSHDKGKTWYDWKGSPKHLFTNMFGDIRSFWINPKDPRHLIVGSDGGVYVTYDGGKNLNHLYHLPMGEVYTVETDMEVPYNIYVGLQDHEGWKTPSNGSMGEISTIDWRGVGMWDGMYHAVDKENSRWLYFTTQFGAHHRVDQLEGERFKIEPEAKPGEPAYRYTWNTPLVLSPHDNDVLYTGGQMLLRSPDKGETWEEISEDLTTNNAEKIDGKGHIMYCTITTISESPVKAGLIWVGTDDGKVHMTPDNGASWIDLTKKIEKAGVKEERWVSRVLASSHDEGVAYVTKSGYRNDDFHPYVFMTEDYGETWKDISAGLPMQPVSVILEDDIQPDLLFVGNDHGVYLSLDRGASWTSFSQNIPHVPVKDLHIHARDRDLIVGTYGRGTYVTDIYPFREVTQELLQKELHLFEIEPKPNKNYSQQASWTNRKLMGDSHLTTPNEDNGTVIYYYLKHDSPADIQVLVMDEEGNTVFERSGRKSRGFHKFVWDTRNVEPGNYEAAILTGGVVQRQTVIVLESWKWQVGSVGRSLYKNRAESEGCAYELTPEDSVIVSTPPVALGLDPFYKKYVNVNGIHIAGSEKVPDRAFWAAGKTISFMTQALPVHVYNSLIEKGTRVGIMARYEGTTDIPEHAHLVNNKELNMDVRARGLGGSIRNPLNTCAEENLLCYQIDKYHAEDILIHEFAHTIHGVGIIPVDDTFNDRLQASLDKALSEGKWENTYASTNIWEYWAEGVQTWFNVNAEVAEPDGKHNHINHREELKTYDPGLYAILNAFFPVTDECISCHSGNENLYFE
jgi:photosystem II stability/assembly factor-like uncharacterized protein